jgi:hypothetical protein
LAECGGSTDLRTEAAEVGGSHVKVRFDPKFTGSRPYLLLYHLGSVRLDPSEDFRSRSCLREVRTAPLAGIGCTGSPEQLLSGSSSSSSTNQFNRSYLELFFIEKKSQNCFREDKEDIAPPK